jgi:hypothetical protein
MEIKKALSNAGTNIILTREEGYSAVRAWLLAHGLEISTPEWITIRTASESLVVHIPPTGTVKGQFSLSGGPQLPISEQRPPEVLNVPMANPSNAKQGLSCWAFYGPEPEWHKQQRPRWDALENAGWRFSLPHRSLSSSAGKYDIGLTMRMGGTCVQATTEDGKTLEELHAWLLNVAEGAALMDLKK